MGLFIGTKLIKAQPMTRLEYNEYRGWELPEDEEGSDEGCLVEYIDGGQPNHPDHKGYISWSPKDVFANVYKASGELTFGMAIEAAKKGYKVSRIGWNGKGMYAAIMPGHPEGVEISELKAKVHNVPVGTVMVIRPYWVLKTAQDDVSTWAPSGSDSLAEDWCIVS